MPAGSPSETAIGKSGARAIAAALNEIVRSAEFDHRIAAEIAQITARTAVRALLVELTVDLIEARRGRIDFIAAADHEGAYTLLERAERLRRLTDLHRQHQLLKRRREVTHLDPVLLDNFAVELGGNLVGAAAAANRFGRL